MKRAGSVFCAAVLVCTLSGYGLATTPVGRGRPHSDLPDELLELPSTDIRTAKFTPIAQFGMEPGCASFRPPRLVTVVPAVGTVNTVAVDVIVAADGTVESLLVLDSSDSFIEKVIAERISQWTYKPATCNGVPVAAEGRVEVPGSAASNRSQTR